MPVLEKRKQFDKWFCADEQFNELYPLHVRALSARHWTPLAIARKAARFLVTGDDARILDIGSGSGKFCLAASHFSPHAFYYGIEQRQYLVQYAEAARKALGYENVSFIHGNFTQLDFNNFDHFYFFNSFYENLVGTDKIDDDIEYSTELFNYYNRYLFKQLEQKPAGTRLVTFHSLEDEVPSSFRLVDAEVQHMLKFWIKE